MICKLYPSDYQHHSFYLSNVPAPYSSGGANLLGLNIQDLIYPKLKGGHCSPRPMKIPPSSTLSKNNGLIHQSVKDWVAFEHLQSPLQVISLPWLHPKHYASAIKAHTLIGRTLEIFCNISKTKNPSPWLGPLIPLRDNPDFPPRLEENFLSTIWPNISLGEEHYYLETK